MAAVDEVTADFMYVRLHGDEELYVSGYPTRRWTPGRRRVPGLGRGRAATCFVYFDNDVKVHAPYDAMALMDRLGLTVG